MHNREACARLLDDYVLRGRDQGITEKYLREACSLPPVQRGKHDDGTAVSLALPKGITLGSNEDSQETKPPQTVDNVWRDAVRWLLREGHHGLTAGYLHHCPLGRTEEKNKKKNNGTS
ncbi:MAG: hypothetical protein GY768_31000 [Planctomycetaceae bacterium]|nr:hypothetical protein [Planctomycetaceae bacterium]